MIKLKKVFVKKIFHSYSEDISFIEDYALSNTVFIRFIRRNYEFKI